MNVKANKTKKQANVENQAVKLIILGQSMSDEENYVMGHSSLAILQKALRMPRHVCWYLRQKWCCS